MFHANGWTYVWMVTAAGATHVCLPKVEPSAVFSLVRDEHVTALCAAPTVLIGLANAPPQLRGEVPTGVRVITAGAPPAAATIERMEGEFGWEVTQVYGLTETSPFITICEPRPEHAALALEERSTIKARTGVELITSGDLRVVDEGAGGPARWPDAGRDRRPRQRRHEGLLQRPRGHREGDPRGLVPHRRCRGRPSGRLRGDPRPHEGRDHQRRREHLLGRGGGRAAAPSGGAGSGGRRDAGREMGRSAARLRRPQAGRVGDRGRDPEFVRSRLAHFKAPQWVSFVDELPKTATGKIQKYVLRKGAPAIVRL